MKYLFRQGVQQSEKRWPEAAFSILSFHDATEWFLRLTADHLGVSLKESVSFMDYWGQISDQGKIDLGHKGEMSRLNGARGELKHRATLPDRSHIAEYRRMTETFLVENTRQVFKLSFGEVSLLRLVGSETIRSMLSDAQAARAAADLRQAVTIAKIAYDRVMSTYRRVAPQEWRLPLDMRGLVPRRRGGWRRRSEEAYDPRLEDFASNLGKALVTIVDRIHMLGLGFNYADFIRFNQTTPAYTFYRPGEAEKYQARWLPGMQEPTDRDAAFCIAFVVDAALWVQSLGPEHDDAPA